MPQGFYTKATSGVLNFYLRFLSKEEGKGVWLIFSKLNDVGKSASCELDRYLEKTESARIIDE